MGEESELRPFLCPGCKGRDFEAQFRITDGIVRQFYDGKSPGSHGGMHFKVARTDVRDTEWARTFCVKCERELTEDEWKELYELEWGGDEAQFEHEEEA